MCVYLYLYYFCNGKTSLYEKKKNIIRKMDLISVVSPSQYKQKYKKIHGQCKNHLYPHHSEVPKVNIWRVLLS